MNKNSYGLISVIKRLFLVFFLLSLFSCSGTRQQGITSTKLILGGVFSDSAFQSAIAGGLIIYGQNKTGPGRFFLNVTSGSDLQKELPLGVWEFVGIAWDGETFEGNVSCEVFTRDLSEEEEAVTLIFSKEKCRSNTLRAFGISSDPFFDTDGQFSKLKLHTCAGFQEDYIEAGGILPTDGVDCQYEAGKAKSFKIEIPGHSFFDIAVDTDGTPSETHGRAKMESSCIGVDINGESLVSNASFASNVRFPFFFNPHQFPVRIVSFDQDNCAGSEDVVVFNQGLGHGNPNLRGASDFSDNYTNVYLDSVICEGAGLDDDTFGGSAFIATSTNYICTPNQLAFINSSAAHLTGRYRIIKDLDLGGNSLTIAGTGPGFGGEISGAKIMNGASALFGTVVDGARIYNFELDNFDIELATGNAVGIFINQIDTSAGYSSQIENIKIKNSQITHNGSGSMLGALIGRAYNSQVKIENIVIDEVDLVASPSHSGRLGLIAGDIGNSASGNSFIEIMRSSIKNSTIHANGVNYVAGGVGHIRYVNPGAGAIQRFAIRNSKFENIGILQGGSQVGGVIGLSFSTVSSPVDNEIYKVEFLQEASFSIQGKNYVGGFVGKSTKGIRIMNSRADVSLQHYDLVGGGTYFGGIGGYFENGYISNNTVKVKVRPDNPSLEISKVGGVSGALLSMYLKNNDINIDFEFNGDLVGGVAGISDSASGSSSTHISHCRVNGEIKEKTAIANNGRGGLIGQVYDDTHVSYCHTDLEIHGKEDLGGAIGKTLSTADEVSLSDLSINGKVIGSWELRIGGGVGAFRGTPGALIFRNSTIDVQVHSLRSSLVAPTFSKFGNVEVDCIANDNIINVQFLGSAGYGVNVNAPTAVTDLFSSNDCTNNTNDLGGVTVGATLVTDPFANLGSNSYSGDSWEYVNSEYKLSFIESWKKMDSSQASFGTYHNAFNINNPADWNKISDDKNLMAKTFRLGSDIDFANNFTTPIASIMHQFEGVLIPNYKKILNAHFDVSSYSSSPAGLFSVVGRPDFHTNGGAFAQIGDYDDPLVIKNANFSGYVNSDTLGIVIGEMGNGNLTARVEGDINVTGSLSNVGGLIGRAFSGRIGGSGFKGQIEAPEFYNVGGLIGLISHTGSSSDHYRFSIDESFASLTVLKGGSNIGGLVGKYDVGGSVAESLLEISQSYVEVTDRIEATQTSASVSGLIGHYFDNNSATGQVNAMNSYVDISKMYNSYVGILLSRDDFYRSFGAQTAYYAMGLHFIGDNFVSTKSHAEIITHTHFDDFYSAVESSMNWEIPYDWRIQENPDMSKTLALWWEHYDERCFDSLFSEANPSMCSMD